MVRDSLLIRVAAAVVLVLTGWLFWHKWGMEGPNEAETVAREVSNIAGNVSPAQGTGTVGLGPDGTSRAVEPLDSPSTAAALPPVVVHVAGAVAQPGLYTLSEGARVHDAIVAAGGSVAESDVDRLNLAALLTDGQKVYVPRPGEAVELAEDFGSVAVVVVSINQASTRELETLPGIGPVLAGRIVAYRQQHGPFQRIEDLTKVSGIGAKLLEQLRPHVRL